MKSKLPHVSKTIFSVMTELANKSNAVNLSQGFPSFDPPSQLIDFVNAAMQEHHNQYAPLQGWPELIDVLKNQWNDKNGTEWIEAKHINITAGATQAIFTAIQALIHPGDEVIIFDPAYDSYKPAVQLAGGIIKTSNLKPLNFKPNWEDVASKINDQTKMIIINTPHNPSGSIWNEDDWQTLESLVTNKNIIILSDEVYNYLVFDGQNHISALDREAIRDHVLAVFSFGKSLNATGWKIGYMIGNEFLMKEYRKVHQYNVFSVHRPSQVGIAKFLQEYASFPYNLTRSYENRQKQLESGLRAGAFQSLPCHGTYFQLYDYSHISDQKDIDFCKQLTQKHKVASIPISVFYTNPPEDQKLIRICFAKTKEEINTAIERLNSITKESY